MTFAETTMIDLMLLPDKNNSELIRFRFIIFAFDKKRI
jgi:hypothetical protein